MYEAIDATLSGFVGPIFVNSLGIDASSAGTLSFWAQSPSGAGTLKPILSGTGFTCPLEVVSLTTTWKLFNLPIDCAGPGRVTELFFQNGSSASESIRIADIHF